jgi:outer membrane biosynthesis protein TonB
MSFKDNELHLVAALGACVVLAALTVPVVVFAGGNGESSSNEPPLQMDAIEASIAYKKAPAKQPQKKQREPDPVDKPDAISRSDDKITDAKCCTSKSDCATVKLAFGTDCGAGLKCERHQCVKAKPDKPEDNKDPLAKVPDRRDPDEAVGKPTTEVGDFNDNARGFAETTTGDEYSQGLAADFNEAFEYPKVLSASGSVVGCLHILADGKVAKYKIDQKSGDDTLDDAMERALKAIEKLRNEHPKPVPTYLLKAITTQWRCFKTKNLEQQR